MDSQCVCLTCNKSFSRKSNLTRHVKQFHQDLLEIPYIECDDCDATFKTKNELMEHQKIHEVDFDQFNREITSEITDKFETETLPNVKIKKEIVCKICGIHFTTDRALGLHEKTHNINLESFCFICNKSFSRKPNLTRHIRQFHSEEVGTLSFQCVECDKSFETKDTLIEHEKVHKTVFEGEEPFKKEKPGNFESDVLDSSEEDFISNKFECKDCNKDFTTNKALALHRKKHANDIHENLHVCYICHKSFSVKSNMTRHLRHVHRNIVEEPLFQCGKCDKSFPSKESLNEHKKIHDINKVDLFKCSQCPKKFAYRKYVQRHERMVHKNEKPIICEFCGKSFSYYRKHKSCVAYSESPSEKYECGLCLKILTSKAGLLYHKFRCPKLQPEESSNNSLQNSKMRHKCSYCDKYFSGPKKREDHERIHTGERPYECEICSKTYKNSTYLSSHKKRHVADKSFKCSYCTRSFIYERLLKIHERIHTDERPFKCKYCEKSFTRKHILFGHEILHLLKNKNKDVKYTVSNDHIVLDSFEEVNEEKPEVGNNTIENNEELSIENGNIATEEEQEGSPIENLTKIEKTEILFLQSDEDEDESTYFENLIDIDIEKIEKHKENLIEDDKEQVKKFEIIYFKNNENEKHEDELSNCTEDPSDISYEMDLNEPLSSDDKKVCLPNVEDKKEKAILVIPSRNLIVNEKISQKLNSESKVKSYICSYCGKQYSKMLFLKIHEGKHTGDEPYKCEICNKNFVTKTHLSRHNTIHKNANKYICKFCNKAFNRKLSLIIHERTHTGEMPFKCDKCEKCFRSNVSLREHQKDFCKLNRRSNTFQCNMCTKTFHSIKTRNSHENRVHRKVYERPHCDLCGKTYSCRQAYKNHRPCMKIPEKSTERFQCIYCSKVFTTKEGLKYHIRICLKEPQEEVKFNCDENDDKRRHKCSFCGKGFTGPKKREDHERIHTGERPFKCDICSKSYKDAKYLTSHKKRHAFKKSFKCSYCTRSFIFEKLRIIHERVHTGERPFQCKHCEKSYTTKYALYSHESVHILNDDAAE